MICMLVIISDSHDNLVNLQKALTWARDNQAEAILHCGDLTNSDTLELLATTWTKPIYLVQGNGELYERSGLKKYPQIVDLGRSGGVFDYQDIKIGICHEPRLINPLLEQEPAFIFYGHTHQPWEEIKAKSRVINPGNLDGSRNPATMASYDHEARDLKLILLSEI